MPSIEQLPTFPAEEGPRRASLEGQSQRPSQSSSGIVNMNNTVTLPLQPAPSHSPSRVEKRTRKAFPTVSGPYLHPLPTIETLMTYPPLSRPMYDSLLRGEPPAQEYNTVIHVPKPANMRRTDINVSSLPTAAELMAYRRRKRSNSSQRSRSSTSSSTSSTNTNYSDSSSVAAESDSSASDVSEPSSPVSISSTTKATVGSPTSPSFSLFPSIPYANALPPTFAPSPISPLTLTPAMEPELLSQQSSVSSSPTGSFHSTHSSPEIASSATPQSDRSSAPSPASDAYPSPPTSPNPETRRSSSSGEEFMYPSPPASPLGPERLLQRARDFQGRERRAFSFPPPPTFDPSKTTEPTLAPPKLRRRSASLSSHPLPPFSPLELEPQEFDLGAQSLAPYHPNQEPEEGEMMEWSMNGGSLVFGSQSDIEVYGGEVYLGSAGLALSPRALQGNCCHCCEGPGDKGLGLYVIDEEEEEPRTAT